MDAVKVGAKGVSPAAARAEAKGARAAAAAETVTWLATGKGQAGKRTGVESGEGAGERAEADASARAGYSSEAASHPFAVQARDQSNLPAAIDVLQDPLVDAISAATPLTTEDAMVQARELGLDGLLDFSSHADAGEQNGDAAGKQNGDAGGKQNGDEVLGNGHNEHGPAHKRLVPGIVKLQHAAHMLMYADTVDNRLYRTQLLDDETTNKKESIKQADELIQELYNDSEHGENGEDVEDMTGQPTTNTSKHTSKHAIKRMDRELDHPCALDLPFTALSIKGRQRFVAFSKLQRQRPMHNWLSRQISQIRQRGSESGSVCAFL